MTYNLDYSLISGFDSTPNWMQLREPSVRDALKKIPKTEERVLAALSFCHKLRVCKPDDDKGLREAGEYFRSALTEFCSIKDILNYEIGGSFNLRATNNPLPHILVALRNLQLHIAQNSMERTSVSLVLGKLGLDQVTANYPVISCLEANQLREVNDFKGSVYAKEQAKEMVDWVNEKQSVFGIHHIIYLGVEEVAERIVKTYSL